MSTASLLKLASAANEAAIAYREARDDPALRWSYLPSYSARLLHAVDALTAAVVEAENDRPSIPRYCPGWTDPRCQWQLHARYR